MSHQVKLLSVSSAVPSNMINQREVAKVAHDAFSARFDDFDRLVKVFESSGILRRFLVQPLDWYLQPLGWSERNAAYLFARITCKPLAGVTSHSQVLVLNWENKLPERPVDEPKAPRPKKPRRGS